MADDTPRIRWQQADQRALYFTLETWVENGRGGMPVENSTCEGDLG